jgi:hypothetical protein
VADEAHKEDAEKKRGPRGGIAHDKPGRGHARKSGPPKKRRFQRKAAKKRQAEQDELRKQWELWDRLPREVKNLRPDLEPRGPRPEDES